MKTKPVSLFFVIVLLCLPARAITPWATAVNEAKLSLAHNDLPKAKRCYENSFGVAQAKMEQFYTLQYLAETAMAQNKFGEAEVFLRRALAIAPDADDKYAVFPKLIEVLRQTHKVAEAQKYKNMVVLKESAHKNDSSPDIDFGPYMKNLQSGIKANWHPPKDDISKTVVVLWKVDLAGRYWFLHVSRSSGSAPADQAAIEAVEAYNKQGLVPLPEGSADTVDIQFTFDFNGKYQSAVLGPGSRTFLMQVKSKDWSSIETQIQKKIDGLRKNGQATQAALIELADCYMQQGKLSNAKQVLDEVTDYYRTHDTKDATRVHALKLLGDLEALNKNIDQASRNYDQAIAIGEQIAPAGAKELQEALEAYAKFLYKSGRADQAKIQYDKLGALRQKNKQPQK